MKDYLSKFFQFIGNLKKTPRGKAILFFGFYFFFFLFLTIFLRGVDTTYPENQKQGQSKNVISMVQKNGKNYHFQYDIGIDNDLYTLKGLKIDYEETFDYQHGVEKRHYFRGMFSYFMEDATSNYHICERPLEELLIVDNIDALLENATYESKTEYSSGKVVLRYAITSSSIERIAFNRDLDVADEANEIIITFEEDRITDLEFRLDSYGKSTGKCQKMMRIVCQYSDFDTKEEIVNPVG